MKQPSFQFYPGDWMRSSDLRSCSVGARGLWMDMICLMHEGSPYGYLKVGSMVILPANLARMVGATLPEVEGWLDELHKAGVYSMDENGCIFSRRMIRDEEIRKRRASGGKLGGNPNLVRKESSAKDADKVANKDNLRANLQPTPSSSSSSAYKNPPQPPKKEKMAELKKAQPLSDEPDEFDRFWDAFPKRDGANPKEPARKKFVAMCKSGVDASEIIAGAAAYAAAEAKRSKVGTPYITQAVTWLNQQRWKDYGQQAEPKINANAPTIFIEAGTAAWKAWDTHLRTTGQKPKPPMQSRQGFGNWFPAQFPLAGGVAKLPGHPTSKNQNSLSAAL